MKLLHVHSQGAWHDDVYIVGNRAALEGLRAAIESALEYRTATEECSVSDGEGFNVIIVCNDYGLVEPSWQNAAVPYHEDFAAEHREGAIWPSALKKTVDKS